MAPRITDFPPDLKGLLDEADVDHRVGIRLLDDLRAGRPPARQSRGYRRLLAALRRRGLVADEAPAVTQPLSIATLPKAQA